MNPMHVVHVTRFVHTSSLGGTEVFIRDLLLESQASGQSASVWWISGDPDREGSRLVDPLTGIEVVTFSGGRSQVDEPGCEFEGLVLAEARILPKDSVVHFHTFGLSEAVVARVCGKAFIPYVYTFHSPAWSCRRGDLLRNGREVCDGAIRPIRCTSCLIQRRTGAGKAVVAVLTLLAWVLHWVRPLRARSRLCASIPETLGLRSGVRSFLERSSSVVACSDWGLDVLRAQGVSLRCLKVIPQGVGRQFVRDLSIAERDGDVRDLANVLFVGRLVPEKGVHHLLRGFLDANLHSVTLTIVGCADLPTVGSYEYDLRKLASGSDRVRFVPQVNGLELVREYRNAGFLAIPSVWPETGPLTLFEGAAAGCHVLGTPFVGHHSLLAAWGSILDGADAPAWSRLFSRIFEPGSTASNRSRDRNDVRDMAAVYRDYLGLYSASLGAR